MIESNRKRSSKSTVENWKFYNDEMCSVRIRITHVRVWVQFTSDANEGVTDLFTKCCAMVAPPFVEFFLAGRRVSEAGHRVFKLVISHHIQN